jgi:hypothetical protein
MIDESPLCFAKMASLDPRTEAIEFLPRVNLAGLFPAATIESVCIRASSITSEKEHMPTRPLGQLPSQLAISRRPDSDLATWWSAHFAADGVEQLSVDQLLNDARSANLCIVVSAYLAMDWLEKLLEAVPAECKVQLHINEGELKRKPNLRKKLGEEIERRSSPLRVRLHQPRGGMFHTKLYAFRVGQAWTIWTGSANASMQAFGANEELMLRARGKVVSPLKGYLKRLKQDGKPFKDASAELPPDDIRALLLSGRLYLRRDWETGLRLPIEARSRPSAQQETKGPPGYVAPRGGKSSFDIAAALDVTRQDDNRSRMKKLSVATCYGLWSPQGFQKEIEADRAEVQERRERILARIWEANEATDKTKVRERFHDVLDFVTQKQWRNSADPSGSKGDPDIAFDRFYDRLFGHGEGGDERVGKLSPCLRARLANPLYSGIVPDVFTNGEEADEFVNSFFESLEAESYKAKSQNRVWRTIRHFCDLEHQPYMADDIRRELEACLRKSEFREERWAGHDHTASTGEAVSVEDDESNEVDE